MAKKSVFVCLVSSLISLISFPAKEAPSLDYYAGLIRELVVRRQDALCYEYEKIDQEIQQLYAKAQQSYPKIGRYVPPFSSWCSQPLSSYIPRLFIQLFTLFFLALAIWYAHRRKYRKRSIAVVLVLLLLLLNMRDSYLVYYRPVFGVTARELTLYPAPIDSLAPVDTLRPLTIVTLKRRSRSSSGQEWILVDNNSINGWIKVLPHDLR